MNLWLYLKSTKVKCQHYILGSTESLTYTDTPLAHPKQNEGHNKKQVQSLSSSQSAWNYNVIGCVFLAYQDVNTYLLTHCTSLASCTVLRFILDSMKTMCLMSVNLFTLQLITSEKGNMHICCVFCFFHSMSLEVFAGTVKCIIHSTSVQDIMRGLVRSLMHHGYSYIMACYFTTFSWYKLQHRLKTSINHCKA